MACTNCGSDEVELCQCDDGKNSFTVTTANFVQPAVSTNVTITVSNVGQYSGKFATPGQLIYVQGAGYFRVQSSTNTQIVGQYSSEFTSFNQALAAAGATVTSGKRVSPGGEKGTTGSTASTLFDVFAANSSNTTSQTGSFADIQTFALPVGIIDTDEDSIRIRAKYFFNRTTSTITNLGIPRIVLTENANSITVTRCPTSLGGGDVFLAGNTGGMTACELEIIVSRASATTANYQLKITYQGTESYAGEETDYQIKPVIYQVEQLAVSTITWSQIVTVRFQGQVTNASDELKLGFFSIENLQKA